MAKSKTRPKQSHKSKSTAVTTPSSWNHSFDSYIQQ